MQQSKQVFICTITGLATHYDIPAIQGKGVEYLSPISQGTVARQYATLSFLEIQALANNHISAIFLSLANEFNLLDDKLSAVERNQILSYNTKYDLYQGIRLLSSITKKQSDSLPLYSMTLVESLDDKQARIKLFIETYQGYIKTLRENLTGTFYENNKEAHSIDYIIAQEHKALGISDKSTILKLKTSNLKASKEAYKKHLEILKDSELSNSRVLEYLKTIGQNSNLVDASNDVRIKVISNLNTWLESVTNTTTRGAIASIQNILTKTAPTPLAKYSKEEPVIATTTPKRTLAEILAARKQGEV